MDTLKTNLNLGHCRCRGLKYYDFAINFIIWSFAQSQAQSKFWPLEKQWLSQIHDILILKPSPIYSKYRYTGTKIDIFYAIYGPANRFPLSFISYHITARGQLHFCHTISFFPCLLFMCQ